MVNDLVERLREHATDWDGKQMPDLEPAKGDPTAGTLRHAADRIEALEAALRSVAKTCREEIPLPYVGKMREVLLRNLAEWCEQALESSDA